MTSRMMAFVQRGGDEGAGSRRPCRRCGTQVAVVAALVVLRGGERQHGLAARDHDEADLFSMQEFFDHDGAAGAPKLPPSMALHESIADSWVSQMTTPFPAASPSALTTTGRRCARMYAGSKVAAVNAA